MAIKDIYTDTRLKGKLIFDTATELTISSGAITPTQVYHTVDTESDAASDDLTTISGGTAGDVLYLQAIHTDRTVVVKHGTGNILVATSSDYSLDDTSKTAHLIYDGTNWHLMGVSASGTGSDSDAIHDNVSAEISAVTEKTSPVSADVLLIEDSAASYAKKKVQVGNLPAGSSSGVSILDRDLTSATVSGTTDETTVYSYSVPGGTLGSTKRLRLVLVGTMDPYSSSSQNITWRVKLGSTTVFEFVFALSTTIDDRVLMITSEIQAVGATNSQYAFTSIEYATQEPSNTGVSVTSAGACASKAATEDSTGALTLAVTCQPAHTGVSAVVQWVTVEVA